MKTVSCDRCGAPVRRVGFAITWIGGGLWESGDGRELCGEYCSTDCVLKALDHVGAKRPDFDATRELLERQAYERALDDEGAPPLDDITAEASLPYTPPGAVPVAS